MPIPEQQLEIWSHQGSVTQSSNTYQTIKGVLEDSDAPYARNNYQIFLQGSYGNDTNIYAESDVDIIVKLNDTFHSDLSELSTDQQAAYQSAYPNASYPFTAFKRDVLQVLTNAYGTDVSNGSKAISIAASGSRREADVVAAVQYRRYIKFNSIRDQDYTEGICFFTSNGTLVANYPRQHSENLTGKHQDTNKRLKPLVRVLKNLRSKLVDDRIIKAGLAPSYYLEGLLYNVPDSEFKSDFQTSLANALTWISKSDRSKLLCANRQYYLLWDNSHTSWAKADFEKFLTAAIHLWNVWE